MPATIEGVTAAWTHEESGCSSLFPCHYWFRFPLSKTTQAQKSTAAYSPTIPKTWDDEALASLEVPLAEPDRSPKHISAAAYYRLPVRPIYKSYAQYDSDHEPSGYRDWLRRQDPTVIWDDGAHRPRLETEADWVKAGEIVFDAPVLFFPGLTLKTL